MKIGVLALQGDFEAHAKSISACGIEPVLIKKKVHFSGISGIILPGGESTTAIKLFDEDLKKTLFSFVQKGYPIFGTCAGLILISKKLSNSDQFSFGFLSIEAERNAYGSQKESFQEPIAIPLLGTNDFPAIFIRAPQIKKVDSQVEILSVYKKQPVLVREKNILGATFHPELSEDLRIHKFFASWAEKFPGFE